MPTHVRTARPDIVGTGRSHVASRRPAGHPPRVTGPRSSQHRVHHRYWPVLVAVSITLPESWFLPVTSVRM